MSTCHISLSHITHHTSHITHHHTITLFSPVSPPPTMVCLWRLTLQLEDWTSLVWTTSYTTMWVWSMGVACRPLPCGCGQWVWLVIHYCVGVVSGCGLTRVEGWVKMLCSTIFCSTLLTLSLPSSSAPLPPSPSLPTPPCSSGAS